MTKTSQILLGLVILGGAIFTFLSPLVFSAPPQDQQNGELDIPARRALEKVRMDAWYNKRIPHPACPNCFKVEGEFGINETVPGTAHVITRDIPDPDPLEPGEIRADRHPETGEPLWYKGHQPLSGSTIYQPQGSSITYGWFGFRFTQVPCYGTLRFVKVTV